MKIFPCWRKIGISGNYNSSGKWLYKKTLLWVSWCFLFFPDYQLQLSSEMISDTIILILCYYDIMIWGSWSPGRTILCVEWLGELGAVRSGRSTWDLLSCSGHFSRQSWHQHVASHTQLWAQDSQIGAMITYILLLLLNIELSPVKSQNGFIHFPNTTPEGKDWNNINYEIISWQHQPDKVFHGARGERIEGYW